MFSPRRTACDRCRSHKLRCIRDDEVNPDRPCRRCFRAGSVCATNASARIGRPKTKSPRHNDREFQQEVRVSHSDLTHSRVEPRQPQIPTPDSSTAESYLNLDHATSGHSNGDEILQQLLQQSSHPITTFPDDSSVGTGYRRAANTSRQSLDVLDPSKVSGLPPPLDRREECERRLAGLHSALVLDLNILRGCQTADKCSDIINNPEFSENYNFMIGRMLNSSAAFAEVLHYFLPSPNPTSQVEMIPCDVPTLFSIFTCYTYLTRIYRIVFTCIHDSIIQSRTSHSKLPALFPNLHLAGFSLESHVDLQVKILVEVGERMLTKVEEALGIPNNGDEAADSGLMKSIGTSAATLQLMLEKEAAEVHAEGILVGHKEPLPEIFKALRAM